MKKRSFIRLYSFRIDGLNEGVFHFTIIGLGGFSLQMKTLLKKGKAR
jgi:hypothetical protein